MALRCGVDLDLEIQADEILMAHRRTLPKAHHNDWLSEEQLEMRQDREVLNVLGTVGEYLIYQHGMYKRAYNPLLGKRPSIHKLLMPGMDPWRQLLWEALGGNHEYWPGRFQFPRPRGSR